MYNLKDKSQEQKKYRKGLADRVYNSRTPESAETAELRKRLSKPIADNLVRKFCKIYNNNNNNTMSEKINILSKADEIVNHRSEEKERQYGNFDKSMILMCEIFNAMTNHKYECTPEDMYTAMIAMKFARQAHAHKTDNLLDAAAYIGAMNNFIDNREEEKSCFSIGGTISDLFISGTPDDSVPDSIINWVDECNKVPSLKHFGTISKTYLVPKKKKKKKKKK